MQEMLSLLACVLSRMSLASFIVQFEDLLLSHLLQNITSCLSDNHIVTFEMFPSSHLEEHIEGVKTELAVSMSLLGKVSQVGGVAALKDTGDKDAADFCHEPDNNPNATPGLG